MKLNLKGTNVRVSDDLRAMAEDKFSRLDKFFKEDQEVDVKFTNTPIKKEVEATIYLDGGAILRAEEAEDDFQTAMDRVEETLIRQVRKHKTKLQKNRRAGDSIRYESFESFDEEEEKEEESRIVRNKKVFVKPMSAEEACLQMDLLGHNFFVYLDGEDMDIRVVYKRKDGDYGLIIPAQD